MNDLEKKYYLQLKKQFMDYSFKRGLIEKKAAEVIYNKKYTYSAFKNDIYSSIILSERELKEIYKKVQKAKATSSFYK